ncbi:MAG: MBL fold metallo-hydrolase [Gammaproteobacteria bacterium]|jgi:phosphoribosyl 1,2-cyclic phosphodiesterase
MLRFASLGSGSKGNATLVESGGTRVLVDCGFSVREVERRLAVLGMEASQLTALVISHEHTDHIRGAAPLSRRYGLPIWMTSGTMVMGRDLPAEHCELFHPHEPFEIHGLEIQPYPVPHDAREPCQFVFSDGQWRLGILTDAGGITPHVTEVLSGCEGLLLECNHDADMLAAGPYPPSLKARVGGPYGHLANTQAEALLKSMDTGRLRHLVGMHLSEQNNTPDLARDALCSGVGCEPEWLEVADQEGGFGWRELR